MEAFVPWKKTRIADKGRGSASNATPDVDNRRNNKGKMTSTGSQSIGSNAAALRRPVSGGSNTRNGPCGSTRGQERLSSVARFAHIRELEGHRSLRRPPGKKCR